MPEALLRSVFQEAHNTAENARRSHGSPNRKKSEMRKFYPAAASMTASGMSMKNVMMNTGSVDAAPGSMTAHGINQAQFVQDKIAGNHGHLKWHQHRTIYKV